MRPEQTAFSETEGDHGTSLARALDRWTALLGADHVLAQGTDLEAYRQSTLPAAPSAWAVLRPGSRDQLIEALAIARECAVPLYPISRGRNWGYGDACPVTEGQVVVDLGRMNRILEVDPDLGYAVIEPGVTQGQLARYIEDNGLALCIDATGAGPETSLVGNVLERGYGHSPAGDRFRSICGLQVVLADGRVLETGFGHYQDAQASRVFPYGVGPVLDGLFTQSNFGIVTKMGLWLQPKPAVTQVFICSVEAESGIAGLVEDLRRLRLNGDLRSIVHIGNELRAFSGEGGFPLDRAREGPPLSPELRGELRRELGVGAWTAWGGLSGSSAQVAVARRAVKRALKKPGRKLVIMDERKLKLARVFARTSLGRGLRHKLDAVAAALDLVRGRPTDHFLTGVYWRRPGGRPAGDADPRTDGCGVLWLSPVMPMTGPAVTRFMALIAPIYAAHGFDLFVTLNLVTERALGAVLNIVYDKADPEEATRARGCYDQLLDSLMAEGLPPYRVGIQSMAQLDQGSDVFWDVAAEIKAALDPEGMIAPGRYQPGRARSQR
ncbi:MAG: FAD-binding oxidoreductase [Pseudomonadota bacterium]